jgi:hypothetical protein
VHGRNTTLRKRTILHGFEREGAYCWRLWWARYSQGHGPVLGLSAGLDDSVGCNMLAYLAADDRFLGLNKGDWAVLFGALSLIVAATFLLT